MTRTRFAPSPTGYLHIGGLRTALYNYLFARKNNGTFVLRIEDTDVKRFVEGAVENLLDTLEQVGLDYDEGPKKDGNFGPYVQSQRTEIYREHAQKLLDDGKAYRCFCTPERLEEMRAKQSAAKMAPMYDRKCLDLTESEIKEKLDAEKPYVIRQKIPHGQKLQFKDLIRGVVNFNTSVVDDQVLIKSDNYPTYHLANVVDDHLMEITHVIRGEEWLPSTPKHILLYEAFGWDTPEFAHIPLLLNKDKSKLSKRQGDVSVESYLEKGYIKEAIINFIALLGWHPGSGSEQEIFSIDQLIESFSLEKVHKGGAIFDLEKLDWFNYRWQKQLHHQELERIAKDVDEKAEITENQKKEPVYNFSSTEKEQEFSEKRAGRLLEICKQHLSDSALQSPLLNKALVTVEDKILKNPDQVMENIEFYFKVGDFNKDLLLNEKMKVDQEIAKTAIQESLAVLKDFDQFDSIQSLQDHLIALVQKLGLKNGQVLWPLRVALTGAQYSPGVFELMWVLGKEESLNRLESYLSHL